MIFTAEDKFSEVMRELKMREWVYAQAVDDGRMKQEVADRRLAIMREISKDYEKLAEGERLL